MYARDKKKAEVESRQEQRPNTDRDPAGAQAELLPVLLRAHRGDTASDVSRQFMSFTCTLLTISISGPCLSKFYRSSSFRISTVLPDPVSITMEPYKCLLHILCPIIVCVDQHCSPHLNFLQLTSGWWGRRGGRRRGRADQDPADCRGGLRHRALHPHRRHPRIGSLVHRFASQSSTGSLNILHRIIRCVLLSSEQRKGTSSTLDFFAINTTLISVATTASLP